MRKLNKLKRGKSINRGGALISALFITAMAAILATALAMQQQLIIRQGELIMKSDQSYLNLQEVQSVARDLVKNYASQFVGNPQSTASVTPLQTVLPRKKRDGAVFSGAIDDEQGKFNLNDLVYTANQPRFVALLSAVLPSVTPQIADNIAQAITAWMMDGSQDRFYLSLNPPYRSSESEFANTSELRLIAGVTPQIYAALKPYVTALPIQKPTLAAQAQASQVTQTTQQTLTQTPGVQPPGLATSTLIDINAVSAPVLMTMNSAMNLSQAQAIVACRDQAGAFHTIAQFMTQCANPSGITTLSGATTTSQYFLASVAMQQSKRMASLTSLLVTQQQKNNTLKVSIVWQSYI